MSGHHGKIEVIGRGVLIENGRVLLCQNVAGGYYYLPGGHVEFGEAASQAVAREFEEETGLTVAVGPCVLVTEGAFETSGKKHHELNVVFHVEREAVDAESKDGAPISREASIAFEFIDLAAIVNTDVRPVSIRAWLASGGWDAQANGGRRACEWVSEIPDPT